METTDIPNFDMLHEVVASDAAIDLVAGHETGAEFLTARTQEAIRSCEVEPTPEVQQALEGYYLDHYGLADMLNGSLDDTITDEQLDSILAENDGTIPNESFERTLEGYDYASFPSMPSAESATRLLAFAVLQERAADDDEAKTRAHELTLRCASRMLHSVLFQERALGITTIGEPELQIVRDLSTKLYESLVGTRARVREGRISWPVNNGTSEFTIEPALTEGRIKDLQDKFWDDCRQAGQLEFHNTGYLGGGSTSGAIMSRTEQMRRKGVMNAQTVVWDNMHSVVPHFSEQYDPKSYKSHTNRNSSDNATGTVAVALADIVSVAPYARDARYAVVLPRNSGLLDRIPLPTTRGIVNIRNGHPDYDGSGGTDRVFFSASGEDEGTVQPDEYAIDLGPESTLIFFGADEINSSQSFGLGEGFPGRLHISEAEDAARSVMQLQAEYLARPRYAARIVVPLRRGIFRFGAEGMPPEVRANRRAPRYNINPLLNRKAV